MSWHAVRIGRSSSMILQRPQIASIVLPRPGKISEKHYRTMTLLPRTRLFRLHLLTFLLLGISCLSSNRSDAAVEGRNDPDNRATFWLESSLKRVFPTTEPGSTNLHLLAARQSKTAFQVCLQNRRTAPLFV